MTKAFGLVRCLIAEALLLEDVAAKTQPRAPGPKACCGGVMRASVFIEPDGPRSQASAQDMPDELRDGNWDSTK